MDDVPSIRLIAATPSATGLSASEGANTSGSASFVDVPWASTSPSSLAPRADKQPARRLVPKKSKLGLLGLSKDKDKTKDFSDVVRRVSSNATGSANLSSKLRGGYDIYVDPTVDPELGEEIVVVKKKKSRAALESVHWNPSEEPKAPREAALKPNKSEEKENKWWTIGRGRKDSKDKDKAKGKSRAKSPGPLSIPRSQTPDPFTGTQSRARFNSLDSGMILGSCPRPLSPVAPAGTGFVAPPNTISAAHVQTLPDYFNEQVATYSRSATPTLGGFLAPPNAVPIVHPANVAAADDKTGSIAQRAIRSVRSMARIGSWNQLRNPSGAPVDEVPNAEPPVPTQPEKSSKTGTKSKKKKKEKKDKEKETSSKEPIRTVKGSSSSFEVGALTPERLGPPAVEKKKSILGLRGLGLGLPSTLRLGKGSTASSIVAAAASSSSVNPMGTVTSTNQLLASNPVLSGQTVDTNRLSAESAFLATSRRSSAVSSGSSLRPHSTSSEYSSGISVQRHSSSSSSMISTGGQSVQSVRWDEDKIGKVKAETRTRRKGTEVKKKRKFSGGSTTSDSQQGTGERKKENRHSAEGRKRTPLVDVFPSLGRDESEQEPEPEPPMLMIEEATSDGHGIYTEDERMDIDGDEQGTTRTPPKVRPRPVSEQLLGGRRPVAFHDDDGVLSILSAATNDLAQLINNLDLEATPGGTPATTPHNTPFRAAKAKKLAEEEGSPTRNVKRPALMESVSSLRPYTRRGAELLGQQIAPWSAFESPNNVESKPFMTTVDKFRKTHSRTPSSTPGPEPEPSPVLQALQPSRSRSGSTSRVLNNNLRPNSIVDDSPTKVPAGTGTIRPASLLTFGARSVTSSREGSKGSIRDFPPPQVFSPKDDKENETDTMRRALAPDAKRMLGMAGTLGASDSSAYQDEEIDQEDPDSDIPDELAGMLGMRGDGDDLTLEYRGPVSPPPSVELPDVPLDISLSGSASSDQSAGPATTVIAPLLPVFSARVIDDQGETDDAIGDDEEDNTKTSFDFTGELARLNDSGGSDRRSFIEQVESAFKTPAKIHLNFGESFKDGLLHPSPPPPVPSLPVPPPIDNANSSSSLDVHHPSMSRLVDEQEPSMFEDESFRASQMIDPGDFEICEVERIVGMKEPTLLPGSDSLATSDDCHDILVDKGLKPSSSTSSSSSSNGQLNRDFKFGGKSKAKVAVDQPLTLSDIIPPPSHYRSLSLSQDDDSVMQSILAKAADISVRPRRRVESDSSSKRRARDISNISADASHSSHSRDSSRLSFVGFESFEEVRRGFEFHDNRPPFYPPPAASRRAIHGRQESAFSFASISSYGRVTNPGIPDPFDYGLPSLQEKPSSEALSSESFELSSASVEDTFSFLAHQPRRKRVDSDASSFYFKAPSQSYSYHRNHRRHESNMSVMSQGPPVSLYNRSFGAHRRNDSTTSASSVALSYAMHGASGGRAAWARHRQDASVDSNMSDYSVSRLGRPGIGDKMFDTAMPLTAISASPPESLAGDSRLGNGSYDSILDSDRRSYADSLFDKTGNRTSSSDESVFGYGYDYEHPQGFLLPPFQYRPPSVFSMASVHSPMKEDDTMISMLGGGHVRRRSIGSVMEASPCVRVEKRKQDNQPIETTDMITEPPKKARIVTKASIASTSSSKFGGERMIKARQGVLQRQSLEESCLIAEGEDLSMPYHHVPVFSRPESASSRSRSSTCTSSSGADTPPLSVSDGSSISGGSQSSIDLSDVNILLANSTHPTAEVDRNPVRARARGNGHRRRFSQAKARMSRSSVYETIEEEIPTPLSQSVNSKKSSPTAIQPVYIVDPDDPTSDNSRPSSNFWDDDRGIVALRRFYELRDEAEYTVSESRRVWLDTPFSVYALQSFQPPKDTAAMRNLLEHSVQTYLPLPSPLRPRRARKSSRVSPYPQRVAAASPQQAKVESSPTPAPALQPIAINMNVSPDVPRAFLMNDPKKDSFGLPRPRVPSMTRRTALGWTKRSTGKTSTDLKENNSQSMIMMTPGESLRLNRPRPRGRPTPHARPTPARQLRV